MSHLAKLIFIDLGILVTLIVTAILADTFVKTILGLVMGMLSLYGLIAFLLLTAYIIIVEIIKKAG